MRASDVVWDVEEGRPFLQDAASPAGRHVRHGLGGVRVLRRQLLLLQQDLRRDRLGRDLPRVAVDNEYRDPPRRRAQRRDRARPSDRGRPALREEQVEIAIYLRIETFAAAVGDRDSEVLAARIRREEERMAKYLTAELPR